MSRQLAPFNRLRDLHPVTSEILPSKTLENASNNADKSATKVCTTNFRGIKRRVMQFFLHYLRLGSCQPFLYSNIAVPEHQESKFLGLPRELHNRIIFFLPLSSQLSLRLTCRNLYHSQTTDVPRLFEFLKTSPYSRFRILVWLGRDRLWRQPGSLAVCSRCYGVYKLRISFSAEQKQQPNEGRICRGCKGAIYLNPQHTLSFFDYKDIVRYYKAPGNFSLYDPDDASEVLRMLPEDHPQALRFYTWITSTIPPSSFTRPPRLDSVTYMKVECCSPRPLASPYDGVNLIGLLHWRHLIIRTRRTKLAIVTFYTIRFPQHGSCRFPVCPHYWSNEKALCDIVRSNRWGDFTCHRCHTKMIVNMHNTHPHRNVSLCTIRYFGEGIAPDKEWLQSLE